MVESKWLAHHKEPEKTAIAELLKSGKSYYGQATFFFSGGSVTLSGHKFPNLETARSSIEDLIQEIQSIGLKAFFDKSKEKGDRT